jgi:hypothetical protein
MTVKWRHQGEGWYIGSGFAEDPDMRARYKLGERWFEFTHDPEDPYWSSEKLRDVEDGHVAARGMIEDFLDEPYRDLTDREIRALPEDPTGPWPYEDYYSDWEATAETAALAAARDAAHDADEPWSWVEKLASPRSKAKTKTPAKRETRRQTKRKTKRKTRRKAASRVRQGKKIAKSLERDSRGRFKPQ